MPNISIQIIEDESSFNSKIKRAVSLILYKKCKERIFELDDILKEESGRAIRNTGTYASLIGGELVGEFGFYQGATNKQERLVELFLDGFKTKVFKKSGNLLFTFSISYDDYSKLFDNSELMIYNKSSNGDNEGFLDWPDWLLRRGNEIIIQEYKILRSSTAAITSRSKQAIMVRGNGATWSVPNEFSGTDNNNWLTQALKTVSKTFSRHISSFIMDVI